eukprot:CAMPEP_0183716302 /NCGR_PEP_ID=MMETSP0737-20130205/10268_1 /TAXON_ID=385413 /ORGANISM="Thalassiosira miniscula, Strain CCMP1093" /LENGTH=348 /DNA_ID=CAMNT_0025945553 /DNA_START=68 /DNA_END=1114 /DNA_ORIENTATION=-
MTTSDDLNTTIGKSERRLVLHTFFSALFVTVISTAILLAFAGVGWPSSWFIPMPENCYENYLTEPNCFCERPRGGNAWFAQPANTASNVMFIVVGILVALSCDLRLPRKYWYCDATNALTTESFEEHHHTVGTPLSQSKGYGILYASVICLMGPGSALLHASLTIPGRRVDQFCMYLVASYIMLYSAIRKRRQFPFTTFLVIYLVSNLLLLSLTILSDNTSLKRLIFQLSLAIAFVIELFWHKGILYKIPLCQCSRSNITKDTANLWYLAGAVGCKALGFGIWIPSKSGGPLCFPESAFQGHAVWHVCTALATGFVYLYALSANGGNRNSIDHDTQHLENDADMNELE